MRLAVFAYHDIGYECLKFFIEAGEEIAMVVTHEDDPAENIWFRSVTELAREHQIPTYTPKNPNRPKFVRLMRELSPDLLFSFYYRRILCKEILDIPRWGGINLHGSLLPRYRGRSPVNWVLINGETETGVTLHWMIEEADAGDIIAQKAVPIDFEDTALTLFRKLTKAAVGLLKETYPLIKEGKAPRIPQDARLATRFGGRSPEDGRINWEEPALAIYNLIRAVTHPYPGAFTFFHGKKLYVWKASMEGAAGCGNRHAPGTVEAVEKGRGLILSTGKGKLRLTTVQLEGGEETAAEDWALKHGVTNGTRLGE